METEAVVFVEVTSDCGKALQHSTSGVTEFWGAKIPLWVTCPCDAKSWSCGQTNRGLYSVCVTQFLSVYLYCPFSVFVIPNLFLKRKKKVTLKLTKAFFFVSFILLSLMFAPLSLSECFLISCGGDCFRGFCKLFKFNSANFIVIFAA